MKTKLPQLVLIFLLFFQFSCGVSSREAADYNMLIVQNHREVANALDSLIWSINKGDSAVLALAYQNYLKVSNNSLETINLASELKIDSAFETASKNLFVFYKRLAKFELKKYVELNISPNQEISIEQFKQSRQISDSIKSTVNYHYKQFIEEQKKFTNKFDLQLK